MLSCNGPTTTRANNLVFIKSCGKLFVTYKECGILRTWDTHLCPVLMASWLRYMWIPLTEGLYIRCSSETRSYLYMQPFHLIHESAIYNETKYRLLYGQEFYIGEFKKQSCQRTFLGLKEVKVSDLCISLLF